MIGRISKVRKRDGRMADFDETKIADAIHKASCAVGREDRFLCDELAGVVALFLEKQFTGQVPEIEEIQDMVEKVLIETGHARMAKAYILYRDKRARVREQVLVQGEGQPGPLVGNMSKARVAFWQKGRIAEALVREANLDEKVAAEIAGSVERRIIDRGVQTITTSVIRALVEAELFDRGFADRVGRQAIIGLPRYDVDRLLRGAKETRWRPAGPADLRRTVADAVLAQYALSEVYSAEVIDSHLAGRLHILDVGSPFEWLAASASVPAATDADAWLDATTGLAGRLGALLTRELLLTSVVPARASWIEDIQPIAAARRLLAHSGLRWPDRGDGRFKVALALPLASPLGDALIREHWARFRSGILHGLPELVVHTPAGQLEGAEGRRACLPALAAAAETGRMLFALHRDTPALVTPWYRLPAPDSAVGGALPVRGAVAVNVSQLAGAPARAQEEQLLDALDSALCLAIKALAQKRSFMAALQADPAGPLYRVAAGARPIVAGEKGLDLVHLVGLGAAAATVESNPAAAARLTGRLRSYAIVRVAEEGRQTRLRCLVAPDRDGEAARRFGLAGPDTEPFPLPAAISLPGVDSSWEPVGGTLVLRFPREEAPAPEALYDTFCLLARDPRVKALRLQPWPDRSVQPAGAEL